MAVALGIFSKLVAKLLESSLCVVGDVPDADENRRLAAHALTESAVRPVRRLCEVLRRDQQRALECRATVDLRDARLVEVVEVGVRPSNLQPLGRDVDALDAVVPVPQQQECDPALQEELCECVVAIVWVGDAEVVEP